MGGGGGGGAIAVLTHNPPHSISISSIGPAGPIGRSDTGYCIANSMLTVCCLMAQQQLIPAYKGIYLFLQLLQRPMPIAILEMALPPNIVGCLAAWLR